MSKLRISKLTKEYKNKKALNHLNLELENGVYGLIGPNGAGKSTLMNIICMLIPAGEGEILFNDEKVDEEFLSNLGYMPQYQTLYENYTIKEYLYYIGALKNLELIKIESIVDTLLSKVDLLDVKDNKISTLSGGMKQRVMLIQALLNDPKVLILDEPTTGLDPKQRIEIRNLISSLGKGRITILATHIVEDIEFIADKIIILDKGELLAFDSPQKLMSAVKPYVKEIPLIDDQTLSTPISQMYYKGQDLYAKTILDVYDPLSEIQVGLEEVYLYYFGVRK